MRYKEYPVTPALSQWMECIWIFEHRSNAEWQETIVADGLPELIVHVASPYKEQVANGQFENQTSTVVSGQLTKPLVLETPKNAKMIGMRFKPCGLARFVDHPMNLLTDQRLPASELFPNVSQLVEELGESRNDIESVRSCSRFLTQINSDTGNSDSAIQYSIQRMLDSYGGLSVDELAKEVNLSRRSLELKFKTFVGVSPKQFCRIIRFRRVFDLLSDPASESWVEIALNAGFFDQSHLIRDFHQFAGDSPTSFLETTTPLAHSILES